MKSPVLRLCFLLAAVSVNFSLMPAAHGEGEPPPFEARFESDAEGTWFVYPTVRGCHYRIESSPATNPADFVVEPGTFHYGSGAERRW